MAILFLSDLHLSAERPHKVEQFFDLLEKAQTSASAVYILGDLFEVWLGDDDTTPPHREVAAALRDLQRAGIPVAILHGNRDFLLGARFAAETGSRLLPEYHVEEIAGTKILLTHGDLLCTKDVKYQEFRKFVRNPFNQKMFLAQSLERRREIAAQTRTGTTASMLEKDDYIMDVDADEVSKVMQQFDVQLLVHGHTHRPAIHDFELAGVRCQRVVLGDWYEEDRIAVLEPGNAMSLLTVAAYLAS